MIAGVPVVTLQPGKYVPQLAGSQNSRNIVQVFNERGDKLFTTALAIPNFRVVRTGKSQFSFWETPRGNPPALKAWFYPGDHWGQEFVYPKGLAAKMARDTGKTVLTTPAETVAELETAPVARSDQSRRGETARGSIYRTACRSSQGGARTCTVGGGGVAAPSPRRNRPNCRQPEVPSSPSD